MKGSQYEKNKNEPSIIFRIEQKVCANNGHTAGYSSQNQIDKHHETINIIDFVCPE